MTCLHVRLQFLANYIVWNRMDSRVIEAKFPEDRLVDIPQSMFRLYKLYVWYDNVQLLDTKTSVLVGSKQNTFMNGGLRWISNTPMPW